MENPQITDILSYNKNYDIIIWSVPRVLDHLSFSVDCLGPQLTAIEVPTLAPRRNARLDEIADEAVAFSRLEQAGSYVAGITPVVSPHIPPSVSRVAFSQAVYDEINPEAQFSPELAEVNTFSPQFLIWWWKNIETTDFHTDFTSVAAIDSSDLSNIISKQTRKAVKALYALGFEPIIWGSWGRGSDSELSSVGLNRGGPTVPMGHCHVADYDHVPSLSLDHCPATVQEKINFIAPLSEMIISEVGADLTKILQQIANRVLPNADITVRLHNSREKTKAQGLSIRNGFCFESENSFGDEELFILLMAIASKFDFIYQQIANWFRKYYISGQTEELIEQGKSLVISLGFSEDASGKFIDLVAQFRPTFGQLQQWLEQAPSEVAAQCLQKQIIRYQRVRRLLNGQEDSSVLRTAVADMTREPAEFRKNTTTLPAHASFCYITDPPTEAKGQLRFKQLFLFPVLASTATGPERVIGHILRRRV